MLPINYVCWQERQMSQDGSNADKKSADHAIPVAVIGAVGAIVAALIAGDGRRRLGPRGAEAAALEGRQGEAAGCEPLVSVEEAAGAAGNDLGCAAEPAPALSGPRLARPARLTPGSGVHPLNHGDA